MNNSTKELYKYKMDLNINVYMNESFNNAIKEKVIADTIIKDVEDNFYKIISGSATHKVEINKNCNDISWTKDVQDKFTFTISIPVIIYFDFNPEGEDINEDRRIEYENELRSEIEKYVDNKYSFDDEPE